MEESFKEQLREEVKKLDVIIYEKQKELLRLKTEIRRVRDDRLGICRLLNEKPIESERPKRKYKKSKNTDEKKEGDTQ